MRLLLLAAMSGEHILLIGPPGTAKSEVGRRLNQLIDGTYFERLLTRFSVPEVRCVGIPCLCTCHGTDLYGYRKGLLCAPEPLLTRFFVPEVRCCFSLRGMAAHKSQSKQLAKCGSRMEKQGRWRCAYFCTCPRNRVRISPCCSQS